MTRRVATALAATVLLAGCGAQQPPEPLRTMPSATRPAPAPSTTAPAPDEPALPSAPEWLADVAQRFVAFARGAAPPPADGPVRLFLGGHPQGVLEGPELADRRQWRICPPEGHYAARVCPFSALAPLAHDADGLVFTSARPAHPCVAARRLPGAPHAVTIVAGGTRDCVSYWAVQLQVDRTARVVGVNLVWAEP